MTTDAEPQTFHQLSRQIREDTGARSLGGQSTTTFLAGMRTVFPLMAAVYPFAAVLGVAITETPLVPDFVGWFSSILVLAGAAQLASVTLLASASGLIPALLGALVVNLRHVMYSAALVPQFKGQPRWFRLLGPYLLSDQTFAVTSSIHTDPTTWRIFYLGAGVCAWINWQIAVAIGVVFGPVLPATLDLSIAGPALFVSLLVPKLKERPGVVAAAVGAGMTMAFSGVPNRGGMLVGGLTGVVAAMAIARTGS